MSGEPVELFASDSLVVRQVGGFGGDRLAITFHPYHEKGRGPELGFGEHFFASRGVDAIHFIPADNRWYQYPELPEAALVVRRLAAGYRRVMTYGSSMGGYAAIRFGDLLGATDALAIAPQFSIDPGIAPFETRWPGEAATTNFVLERRLPPPFIRRAVVVYDPKGHDRAHVELYRPTTRLVEIGLRNTGHLTTWILSDLGLLERLIFEVLDDRLDPVAFGREARARRGQSSWFFVGLAESARNAHRRLALARRACAMAPPEPTHLLTQAIALADLRQLPEALTVFNRAHALAPGSAQMRAYLTHLLVLAGDVPAAAGVLRALVDEQPVMAPPYGARAEELERHVGIQLARRGILRRRLARAVPIAARHKRFPRRGVGVAGRLPQPVPPADPDAWVSALPAEGSAEHRGETTSSEIRREIGREIRREIRGKIRENIGGDAIDIVVFGDDLARPWEPSFWRPFRVVNLACAGEAIEHVQWRLDQLQQPLMARVALVMAGAVNLRRGEPAERIVAGLRAVAQRLRHRAPAAWRGVLELPAGITADPAQEVERRRVNAALRRETLFQTIGIRGFADWLAAAAAEDKAVAEAVGRWGGEAVRPCHQAYRDLTQTVLDALDIALPPLRERTAERLLAAWRAGVAARFGRRPALSRVFQD